MFLPFLFTVVVHSLRIGNKLVNANSCPAQFLLYSAEFMSDNLCYLYNESNLGKIYGNLISEDSKVLYQEYFVGNDTCGAYHEIPMHEYFPVVFQYDHYCSAAIPISSTVGGDGRVTVNGYGDMVILSKSKIFDFTFIYTAPYNDCTLKLQSMIIQDLECIGYVLPTLPTDTNTGGTTGTITSTTISMSSWRSTGGDPSKYTSRTNADNNYADSMNNPLLYASMPVCSIRHPRYKLVLTKASHKRAHTICMQKGMRLARITKADLPSAIGLLSACLGANQAAWIHKYWKTTSPNTCLELVTGSKDGAGGINIASSCRKEQAVLCEDPYIPA